MNRKATLLQALNAAEGGAPEWIELLPPGIEIRGRDGRIFINNAPEDVIAAFHKAAIDIPIDWEHATVVKGNKGDEAPAAGWIVALKAEENGSVWGRVNWNEKGKQQVEAKEYRYISPVILVEKAANRVVKIESVGLTNKPNLHLQALNRQEDGSELETIAAELGLGAMATTEEVLSAIKAKQQAILDAQERSGSSEGDQEQLNEIMGALGLVAGAGINEILAAVRAQDAQLEQLGQEVNSARYGEAQVRNSYQALQRQVEANQIAQENAEIERVVGQAVDDALILPADTAFFRAACRTENGMEGFQRFLAMTPGWKHLFKTQTLGLAPEDRPATRLTTHEQAVCRNLGLSSEQYTQAK